MAATAIEADERRLSILDPDVAEDYARCVARVAPAIEAALGPEVVANRVLTADPRAPALRLEPWRSARSRFRRRLRSVTGGSRVGVVADVRACYPSIHAGVVAAALRSIGIRRAEVRAVVSILEHLTSEGIEGLPIGPDASAVLANAVLRHVDGALRRIGARHVRWVDDIVAVPGRGSGAAILPVLRFALAELALELNERKTRVLLGPDAVAAAVPDLVPSADRPTATLPPDAHPVPGDDRSHALASTIGGLGLGRRPARRARRDG